MKLFRMTVLDHNTGFRLFYGSTANKCKADAKSEGYDHNDFMNEPHEIEFELSKRGVLELLQDHTPEYNNG